MVSREELKPDALKVLGTLVESANDGYTVMKRTGLRPDQLSVAVTSIPAGLLIIKGGVTPERVGEAYLAISPDAQKYAESLLLA